MVKPGEGSTWGRVGDASEVRTVGESAEGLLSAEGTLVVIGVRLTGASVGASVGTLPPFVGGVRSGVERTVGESVGASVVGVWPLDPEGDRERGVVRSVGVLTLLGVSVGVLPPRVDGVLSGVARSVGVGPAGALEGTWPFPPEGVLGAEGVRAGVGGTTGTAGESVGTSVGTSVGVLPPLPPVGARTGARSVGVGPAVLVGVLAGVFAGALSGVGDWAVTGVFGPITAGVGDDRSTLVGEFTGALFGESTTSEGVGD